MAKKVERKSYKNPQIVEAAIEVRFEKSIDNAKVQDALCLQHPCRREDLILFTAQPASEGVAVSRDQTRQFRLHFAIAKHLTAFVYPDRVSFHRQGKYPGWDEFQPAFASFWARLLEVIPQITIGRVGVRFINMVHEKTPDQEVGYWLKSAINYPEGLLSARDGYFYSIRRPLKPGRHIQLFVAEGELQNGGNRPLILDIDVQSDNTIQRASLPAELLLLIDDLHEEVGDVFEHSITQNYLDLLNKEMG